MRFAKYITKYLFIFILSINVKASNGSQAPNTYIDEGACPFECCTYRDWIAIEETHVLKQPKLSTETVNTIKVDQTVEALTGKVITTTPGEIEVLKPYKSEVSGIEYQPGERFFVYTYLGEGYFKIWFKGKMLEEDLGFLLHDTGAWVKCADEGSCWAKGYLPESEWWVNIQTKNGFKGWINKPENFMNKDACG